MRVERVYYPADPRVGDYVGVTDAALLARRGLFIAEGRLVVQTLLGSPRYRARSILVNQAALEALSDTWHDVPDAIPIYLAEQAVIDAIAGFHIHRGCLAAGERGVCLDLSELIADRSGAAGAGPLVVLEDLTNHDNVGGVFRNALAFGARGVLLSPACCDPLYRKAIRVSMGATLRIPFARAAAWPDDLDRLRAAGWVIAALTPAAHAADIRAAAGAIVNERVALLVGAEGPGLTPAALTRADVVLRIPMAPGVDSLNVATACGIALHRLSRL